MNFCNHESACEEHISQRQPLLREEICQKQADEMHSNADIPYAEDVQCNVNGENNNKDQDAYHPFLGRDLSWWNLAMCCVAAAAAAAAAANYQGDYDTEERAELLHGL